MANRRGPGRGTRLGKGVISGSTYTTMPSGVTVSSQGISGSSGTISTTSLGYLDSLAGPAIGGVSLSALLMATNVTPWDATPVAIVTGLTTVLTFTGAYRVDAARSLPLTSTSALGVIYKQSGTAGNVTASVYTTAATGVAIAQSGGSISWLAMGT